MLFFVFGQLFERVIWRFAEGCFFVYAGLSRHRGERRMFLVYSRKGMTGSCGHLRRFVSHAGLSEDSEFEQGLEMLTAALAFSCIILLRIADLLAKLPISPG